MGALSLAAPAKHQLKENYKKTPSNELFAISTVDALMLHMHKPNNAKGAVECHAFYQ